MNLRSWKLRFPSKLMPIKNKIIRILDELFNFLDDNNNKPWAGCGLFVFYSLLSFSGSLWFLFHYGWTAMLISYVLLFPCISSPFLLIEYLLHQRDIRKERERNEANNSFDQTETDVSERENYETDSD